MTPRLDNLHHPYRRRIGASRRKLQTGLLAGIILLALSLSGCTSLPKILPTHAPRSPSYARDPGPDNRLAAVAGRLLVPYGPGASGFRMLDRNADALRWRLLLTDMAQETLDMQYYVWKGDASANLLLDRVIQAADRGVRVRLLVDDILLVGSDAAIAALSRHPRIEVRLFNPVEGRHDSMFLRAMEFAGKIEQLNHRMHNKLIVADNRLAIVGGRNIGDEYFGLNPKRNFLDFDLLALGEVVPEISASFDLFWNSQWAYPGDALLQNHPEQGLLEQLRSELQKRIANHSERLAAFQGEALDAEGMLAGLQQEIYPGTADVIYDEPLVGEGMPPVQLIESLGELTDRAESEILAATPYFIPHEDFFRTSGDLTTQGLQMVFITNSLGANNHPIVHSAYKKHRAEIIDAGIALYEYRRDAAGGEQFNTPPVTAEASGLHAKFIVIDQRVVFVGSLNLDPRSIYINTEMGLLIDSPVLAKAVARFFESLVAPDISWRVRKRENGDIFWQAGTETTDAHEPASSLGNRFQSWFFGLFDLDDQL